MTAIPTPVILSEARTSPREVLAQSKDPYQVFGSNTVAGNSPRDPAREN